MRMRKKPNLIPRMERCAEYLITDPEAWRGRWREKLSPNCALRLELGCGKGRFTCETAARSTSKPTTAVSLSGPSSSFPGRITLFQR